MIERLIYLEMLSVRLKGLQNQVKKLLIKKVGWFERACFEFPMTNAKQVYQVMITKQEIFSTYPLIKHSLSQLISAWFKTKNWKTVIRQMEGENISLIKEGRKWLFSKEQDHWTTLSGLFKAAELGIPLSRKGNCFSWADGHVKLLLRDRFLLGPDVSTVHEVFYENVYKLPIELDLSNYSVLDFGGYIGDSALWFVEQGASEVHVYEPIPVNFEILQKNVELNKELISRKGSKVNIYHEGISDSEKTIEVPYWGGPGTSLDEPLEGKETRKVSTISLEKAFERASKPIGLVKIDCEGCEFQIFSDSKENRKILGEAKAYIVEVHGNDAKTRRIASILKDMGYAIQDVSKLAKNVFVLKATKN